MPPSSPDAILQQTFRDLTGINKGAIGNMISRGQLPFHEEAEGWNEYTYRQAFATRLMIQLGQHIELKRAKTTVEEYLDTFIARFGQDLLAGKQVFFGCGENEDTIERGGMLSFERDESFVAGPLNGLLEDVAVRDEHTAFLRWDLVPLGSQKVRLTQVVLVDAGAEMTKFQRASAGHPRAIEWVKRATA